MNTTLVEVVKTGESVSVYALKPNETTPQFLRDYANKTVEHVLEMVKMVSHCSGHNISVVSSYDFELEVQNRISAKFGKLS